MRFCALSSAAVARSGLAEACCFAYSTNAAAAGAPRPSRWSRYGRTIATASAVCPSTFAAFLARRGHRAVLRLLVPRQIGALPHQQLLELLSRRTRIAPQHIRNRAKISGLVLLKHGRRLLVRLRRGHCFRIRDLIEDLAR